MRILAILVCFFAFAQMSYAKQVAQCLGTLVLDNSPVVAKVYSDANGGKITIETTMDVVESSAKVELLPDYSVVVSDNKFQLSFAVSPMSPKSLVPAFRDGAFFVEDFYCIRVN